MDDESRFWRIICDFARADLCRSMSAARSRNNEIDVWVRILNGKVGGPIAR